MTQKMFLKELDRYKVGTCAEMVHRNALFYPEGKCLVSDGKQITFEAFSHRVNRLVNAMNALGVKKGDVIGILAWNCTQCLEIAGAAMKGGFILSPYNARLNPKELSYLVNYSEAKALFIGEEHLGTAKAFKQGAKCLEYYITLKNADDPSLIYYEDFLNSSCIDEPEVTIEINDPLLIIYTSGTTGQPKGALYDHHRFIEDIRSYVISTGIQPEDKYVMIMPLFHIGGSKVMWSYFYVGGNIILPENSAFDPEATLKIIEENKATDIHIVPTHLSSFLSLPTFKDYDLSSLKRVWYAASPMPPSLLEKGLKALGPIFLQGYGSSETGPNACCLRINDHKTTGTEKELKRLSSCGRPIAGVHVRIVDPFDEDLEPYKVGEIIVSGNIMIEYWQRPEETQKSIKNGFVYTGDMGYYDDKGYIYIVDRKSDMIITGGENVYPREVEDVLYEHPAIKEAAVIGKPDEYWVEKVHAIVALNEGMNVEQDELIAFCKSRLSGYKCPKSIEFAASLPRNPAGKVLKRLLRENCQDADKEKMDF